ncbi:T9SS type A sorting domain-containing protein [Cryomorpha ignava]|uniref:phospholipase D n=1 Tax=Cryomorpha ignava TaxID=101383 RepID=A0A7K3WK37_9FLAO|nr:T9SS type A sorting domain-containing protein [Cryomorpha ignava]NEN21999.1 T9SS type A sorting domain-containing protein [Cryomorpha ignava]
MWGSDLPEPNFTESRFGELKINNTPEKFLIGGKSVELYFSPSDNTTAAIAKAIETAEYDLDFALLTITNNTLANAVADRVSIFLTPRGIVETPGGSGSDFDFLIDEGVLMLSHQGIPGQLHHKYATIDHSEPLSDPMVVTGSHNWSGAAESENDENTLIIHDATIANLFYQEFMALYGVVSGVEELTVDHVSLYPNPASEVFTLVFDSQTSVDGVLRISNIQGKTVFEKNFNSYSGQNKMDIYIGSLNKGVYLVTLSGKWGSLTQKLVKM